MKKFFKENNQAIPAIKFVDHTTPPTGFTEVTDETEKNNLMVEKYHQRLLDGRDFYLRTVAIMMNQVADATQTVGNVKLIQKELEPVRDELVLGQWISAQDEINAITPTHTPQADYDYIKGVIDQYVLDNY